LNEKLVHLLVFTHILTKCTVQEAKLTVICCKGTKRQTERVVVLNNNNNNNNHTEVPNYFSHSLQLCSGRMIPAAIYLGRGRILFPKYRFIVHFKHGTVDKVQIVAHFK
jgi:hypothetical protein